MDASEKPSEPQEAQRPTKPDLKVVSNPRPEEAQAVGTPPPLQELEETPATIPEKGSLDFVLDIPLKVSVEVGRTKILVEDLLKLHKGSVIELTKLAGEPMEILVNDRVVAKGEVIVVNEKFGVRLTDIVSHNQRILELGQ